MTTGSSMKVECIVECSAILLTCIKRYPDFKPILGLFESGRFTQVLLLEQFGRGVEIVKFSTSPGTSKWP